MRDLKKSGIYVIRNRVNGKLYVGSATRLDRRWRQHRYKLRRGIHDNAYLQRSWRKHGEAAFEFEVLEIVENRADLIAAEQKWIDTLNACHRSVGYNICPTAGSTTGVLVSKETRDKLSEANKRRIAAGWRPVLSEHSRSLISLAKSLSYVVISPEGNSQVIRNLRKFCKENNLSYGSMHSVSKGRYSHHRGWRCEIATEEAVLRLSEFVCPPIEFKSSWQGKYVVTDPSGKSFVIDRLTSFCREYELSQGGLWAVLSGRCHHYKGWQVEYATEEVLKKIEERSYKPRLPKPPKPLYRSGYILTDPEGNLYQVRNLHGFCRERGLDSRVMADMANSGRHRHHKRWKCSYPTQDLLDKIADGSKGEPFSPEPVGRRCLIIEPDGRQYEIRSLHGFCKERGLLFSSMQRVAVGKNSHHKGWRCRYLD